VHGLIRHLHERRTRVGIRINRDSLDTHAARRRDDPAGNFAAVGDQDFLEHKRVLFCRFVDGRFIVAEET
jgi:hypothetical protein